MAKPRGSDLELRQLEFFVTTADFGSTSRAAEALYTSQPNVSKVVASLERELGVTLFTRSNKGVHLTPEGRDIYEQAQEIIKSSQLMLSMIRRNPRRRVSLACYPSSMISRLFCDLYHRLPQDSCQFDFFEGTVEDITEQVASHNAELGIVYIAENQRNCFKHVLSHKHLSFHALSNHEACIYVGPNNPLYDRKEINFAELPGLRFVQPFKGFFSMEHHLDRISVGMVGTEQFQNVVNTNSDNQLITLLLQTDVCSFGIRLMKTEYKQYEIRDIPIKDCGKCLTLGYVKYRNAALSPEMDLFLNMLRDLLKSA